MVKVCPAEKSGGIDIYAGFRQVNGQVMMEFEFSNISCETPVSQLAIQLNKNSFGLSPVNQQVVCNPPLTIGASGKESCQLVANRSMLQPMGPGQPASPQIQIAIKNMATNQVFYFAANFTLEALCSAEGKLDRTEFIEVWKNIDDGKESYSTISDLPSNDIDEVQAKFAVYNIHFIARRQAMEGQEVAYFFMKTLTGMDFLVELTFKAGVNACKICIKTESAPYGGLAKSAIENLLRY
jgi:AP-1 complex subunit beta-1